ncbi:MAG: hypothetical protein V7651_18470 [Hyphomonas oceanitis]|uniref:hypothetical protein n=1 Tax=Hyphomonas oceanitis TaxID=81033 RepID=UPI0030038047
MLGIHIRTKLVVATLLMVLLGVMFVPGALAKPQLEWLPHNVSIEVEPGRETTLVVTVSSSKEIDNGQLSVSPELADYIVIEPTVLNLRKHQTQDVTLTISGNEAMPGDVLEGFLEVQSAKKAKPRDTEDHWNEDYDRWESNHYKRRKEDDRDDRASKKSDKNSLLAISISILEPTVTLGDVRVSYELPENWKRSPFDLADGTFSDAVYSPESWERIQGGSLATAPDIVLSIIPNPANQSIIEFQNSDGWYGSYDSTTFMMVDGRASLILDDRSDGLPSNPTVIALIDDGYQIISVGFGWQSADSYDEFLDSLVIENVGESQ